MHKLSWLNDPQKTLRPQFTRLVKEELFPKFKMRWGEEAILVSIDQKGRIAHTNAMHMILTWAPHYIQENTIGVQRLYNITPLVAKEVIEGTSGVNRVVSEIDEMISDFLRDIGGRIYEWAHLVESKIREVQGQSTPYHSDMEKDLWQQETTWSLHLLAPKFQSYQLIRELINDWTIMSQPTMTLSTLSNQSIDESAIREQVLSTDNHDVLELTKCVVELKQCPYYSPPPSVILALPMATYWIATTLINVSAACACVAHFKYGVKIFRVHHQNELQELTALIAKILATFSPELGEHRQQDMAPDQVAYGHRPRKQPPTNSPSTNFLSAGPARYRSTPFAFFLGFCAPVPLCFSAPASRVCFGPMSDRAGPSASRASTRVRQSCACAQFVLWRGSVPLLRPPRFGGVALSPAFLLAPCSLSLLPPWCVSLFPGSCLLPFFYPFLPFVCFTRSVPFALPAFVCAGPTLSPRLLLLRSLPLRWLLVPLLFAFLPPVFSLFPLLPSLA
nr:protein SIEVE ELEMENT OCCLUSION B-like [Ipomoea batatas]